MEFIYRAMGWVMRQIYILVANIHPADNWYISNYAIALIILSVLVKLITIPLSIRQSRSMAKTQALQPKIKAIYDKYGNDELTISRKVQELYEEENINMASGCLPLLIQFPILLGMFRIVREPVKYVFTEPGYYDSLNKMFLWVENIAQSDVIMAVISAVATFAYQNIMTRTQTNRQAVDKEQQEAMESSQKMMNIIMPVMMFFIYRSLPAALPLYITVNMIATAIQQKIVNMMVKDQVEEEVEK